MDQFMPKKHKTKNSEEDKILQQYIEGYKKHPENTNDLGIRALMLAGLKSFSDDNWDKEWIEWK